MDAVTQSLMREAGGHLAPPGGWRIPAQVQAQRDTEARNITAAMTPGGGGAAIPTGNVVEGFQPPDNAPQTPPATAPDPVTASLLAEAERLTSRVGQIPGMPAAPQQDDSPRSLMDKLKGGAEAALSMGTSMVAAPIAAAGGFAKTLTSGKFGSPQGIQEGEQRVSEILSSLTYQPRTEAGQEALSTVGKILHESKLAGLGPTEGMAIAGAMAGPKAIRAGRMATPKAAEVPPGQLASVGAAGADIPTQARGMVAGASAELRAAVERAKGNVDLKVLDRHVKAESLPDPVHLTKGQASGDVTAISREQNLRGKYPQYAKRFEEQNGKLINNMNLIREEAAPDVYVQSKPEVGQLIIEAYQNKDAALRADISAKYRALKDANGGNFPIDSNAFVRAADAALHKQLLYDHVPASVRSTMNRLKEGGMTFENFESLRTNLARIQRTSDDGNAVAAAGVIRDALEELPMPPGAENLKPLADAARKAARDRFALIEADPAYKAIERGRASADKFVDQFVMRGDLKNVERMKTNLAGNAVGEQAIAAGVVNQLKESAGIVNNAGNFSQAGYNKALERLGPKIAVIFKAQERQQLETLGSVARWTMEQPKGSYVNTSNTLTGAIAEGAASAAEGAANTAAKGLPIGTGLRKLAEWGKKNKEIKETLEPGAGIKIKDMKK